MASNSLNMERLAINQLSSSMRRLNELVDAIRAVSMSEDPVPALLKAVGVEKTESSVIDSVVALRLEKLLNDLSTAIEEAEVLEAQRPKDLNKERPRAPLCLLSLRDYTTVQAAVELLVVWGTYPCIEAGILIPVEMRNVSKTMKIDKQLLVLGSRYSCVNAHEQLYIVIKCILRVLQLSQFKPMLLPAYLRDIFACVIYQCHISLGNHTPDAVIMLDDMINTLPLRLTMSSIRAVLGQCHRSTNIKFKAQCGQLLTSCVLKPGGVPTTVEVLLSTVDEGNTQARMQVANLIARCPKDFERDTYLNAIAPQLLLLLKTNTLPKSAKLLRETTGLIVSQLILDYPTELVDKTLLHPLLLPLLQLQTKPTQDVDPESINFIATEEELESCINALMLLLGPPPPQPVLSAMAPILRPLVLLYNFCCQSKSFLKEPVEQLILAYIEATPFSALLLQCSVIPANPAIRSSLIGNLMYSPTLMCHFSAGGSGGAAVVGDRKEFPIDSIIQNIVAILQHSQLESSDVVSDLFTALLTTYMRVKTETATTTEENPMLQAYTTVVNSPENSRYLLQLLVSITEVIGPAILRSATSILQCLVTVIDMYTSSYEPSRAVFDLADGEDEETAWDVLSICLGMITTILEVGVRDRPEAEEGLLRQLLPSLEILSTHSKIDIAEMASEMRLQILARPTGQAPESKKTQLTFENVIALSEQDLASPNVPLRARGLVRLNKLIRHNKEDTRVNVEVLMKLFIKHLNDTESYVYLASIQALSTLSDIHPKVAIPLLLQATQDTTKYSIDQRIKLSEALMFTARRCGDVLPMYSKGFVYAYLNAIRTRSATEDLVEATFRASCLSNLAEVCGLLRWAIQPYIVDIMTCIKGILDTERQHTEAHIALRRGAIYVLYEMLHLMGRQVFEIMADSMTPIYRLIKQVDQNDSDKVCRFHASKALEELNDLMRGELFQIVLNDNDGSKHFLVSMKRVLEKKNGDAPSRKMPRLLHTQLNDLDRLGEEGLVRSILSYLDVKDHHIAKAVCRTWKAYIETLDITRLDLSVRSPLTATNLESALLSTINSYADVRMIDFTGQRSLCDRDLLVLTSCFWSTLESITVDDCLDITDFGLLAILNAQSQRLHTVSFRNCKLITGRFAQSCITGHHPSLAKLDFHNTRIALPLVSNLESKFPSLQSIVATHTPAHHDYFQTSPWKELKEEWHQCMAYQFKSVHFQVVMEDFTRLQKSFLVRQTCSIFEQTLLQNKAALVDLPMDNVCYSSALLHVSEQDVESLVPLLLQFGADYEVTNKDGATPLCLAATCGSVASVNALLKAGAYINARTISLATPLYFASEMDWTEVVAILLANNATTDAKTISNTTPLCVAAKNGSHSSVRELIRHRSRRPSFVRSVKSRKSMSEWVLALCLACERSHYEIVQDILALGLDPNVVMDNGVTPLYLASQMGHTEVIDLLLTHGANPNFCRRGGVTCLYIAAQEGKVGAVDTLIKQGVDVHAIMDDMSSALHIAARMGHQEIVAKLHFIGSNINGQTRSGLTPLFIACEEGHVALVSYLLSLPNIDVDLQTDNGTSALFMACQKGHVEIIALLLKFGVQVNLAKKNGTAPIDAACMLGDMRTINLLLQHGARVGGLALHFAERRKDTLLIALLMSQYQAQWYAPPMPCMIDYVQ
ncbi:hypothetical protein THRCLA_06602 [Thraustotheca clavata]|uniref:Uncharacterized protein n=1 Tax=Thraustotheca clavata TaxID=74557 RepID=A0A1V9ZMW8_9STRA|nr:hypothetical protein THRCLA_06602 [Thraustotheca clavata]